MKNKKPAIRFKGFSEEWEEKELSKIIDLRSGRDYKHLSNGDIPVYGTGGYMTSVNEALCYENDAIGIGRKGTIDKPYKLEAPFWTVDTLFYALPFENNNLDFVFDIFQKINWKQKNEATGVPSLSKVAINSIQAYIPKHKEQTQIGNFFKNLDNLITLHQRKYEKLGILKKAMLEKMFPKNGANVPEIRFKGFEGAWEEKKLGKIAKLGSSKRVHREDYVTDGIPFFRGTEISKLGNSSVIQDLLYISEEYYKELKNKYGVPKNGDILITAVGTLGNVFLISDETKFYFKDGNLIWLSDIQIDSEYLNVFLSDGIGKTRVLESAIGSSQQALTMVKLQNVHVLFPSKEEQEKIGTYFKNLDDLLRLHKKELEKLKKLKKALLEKMFV